MVLFLAQLTTCGVVNCAKNGRTRRVRVGSNSRSRKARQTCFSARRMNRPLQPGFVGVEAQLGDATDAGGLPKPFP
jgi:hypothetical protein